MNRVIILILVFLSVAFAAWSLSDNQSGKHSANLDQAIDEIRSEMGLSAEVNIDPEAVSEFLLKRLGYAIMLRVHPNESFHSWMDGMVGGSNYDSIPYNSPEEVPEQRYARGEINREKYLQAIEDIER